MHLVHLVAACMFPFTVYATMAPVDVAAPVAESSSVSSPSASPSSSSSSSSNGDQCGLGTSRQQRSRSASPPCFGARARLTGKRRAAERKADAVASPEEPKGRWPSKSRSPRCKAAATPPSVSSSSAPPSSPLSTLGERLGITASHHRGRSASPPLSGAHGGSNTPLGGTPRNTRARSPEETKGGVVGSYLRKIISRRMTRGAAEVYPPPAFTTAARSGYTAARRRIGGSAIASEEEIRAFVTASAENIRRNGPPSIPLGLM